MNSVSQSQQVHRKPLFGGKKGSDSLSDQKQAEAKPKHEQELQHKLTDYLKSGPGTRFTDKTDKRKTSGPDKQQLKRMLHWEYTTHSTNFTEVDSLQELCNDGSKESLFKLRR